ncbi:unnamed protein product [Ectocarpus sp. 13 AM-2016]
MLSSPRGETGLAETGSAPSPFAGGDRHEEHAPASADGIYAVDEKKQENQHQHQKLVQPQQPGRRPSASESNGNGRSYWRRFKVIGCMVGGALIIDLYLAFLGSRSEGVPSTRGESFLASSSAVSSSDQHSKDGSRILQFPSRTAALDDENMGIRRRSIPNLVVANGNMPYFDENGVPETGTERALPSAGIKQQTGQATVMVAGEHDVELLHNRTSAVASPSEYWITGIDPWGAQAPPQPTQPDQFNGQKVAVVVPYVGKDLPVWWDAFAEQARLNDGLVDWVIFCDQASNSQKRTLSKLVRKRSPPNIKFFPMTTRRMAWLLAGVVEPDDPSPVHGGDRRDGLESGDGDGDKSDGDVESVPETHAEIEVQENDGNEGKDSDVEAAVTSRVWEEPITEALAKNAVKRKRAASLLHQLLITSPYFIVEFKPAFGWLFREYLAEYSHWAFGDLDVLFGDMRRGWLEPTELQDFDIITFSFGDQYRAYLRGQLTIHKNKFDVNRVWTRCSHLTNYSERLEAFRVNHGLPLESAEGCYSLAAASDPSLRIKFTVKALSDVDQEDEEAVALKRGREVIIDGHGLVTLCPDLEYYYNEPPGAGAGTNYGASDADGGGNGESQGGLSPSMQDAVGPMTSVEKATGRCEHWIKPEHQTCVKDVGGSQTLFLIGGKYYKQEFINTAQSTGGRECRAGAFYHFQARLDIQLREHKRSYRSWNSRPPIYPAHFGISAGPGGIVPLPAGGWRERASGPGIRPPPEHTGRVKHYCLGWTERRQSRTTESGRPEQTCAVMVSSEEVVVVVLDTRNASGREERQGRTDAFHANAVTLGLVGGPADLEALLLEAAQWDGPKIIAMVFDDDDLAATREMDALKGAKYIRGGVLIVALARPPPSPDVPRMIASFPRKALMNLVTDLCETRYLLALPASARLSPRASQAVSAQLRSIRRPPYPVRQSQDSRPPSKRNSAGTGGPRAPRRSPDTLGPITLVVPFETAGEAPQFLEEREAGTSASYAWSLDSPPAGSGDISNPSNKVALPGMGSVSSTVANDGAAEDAARATSLASGHTGVAPGSAPTARGAIESAEKSAAAAGQAEVEDFAAASAGGWGNGFGITSFRDTGGDETSTRTRSYSTALGRDAVGSGLRDRGGGMLPVEEEGGTTRSAGPGAGAGRQRASTPLKISFLAPAGRAPASNGSVTGRDTRTLSRHNVRRQGPAVDSPRPASVTQWRAEQQRRGPPASTSMGGDRAGLGRGGWEGGPDVPITTTASASLSLPGFDDDGEAQLIRDVRRRLGASSGDGAGGRASGSVSDSAVAAGGRGVEMEQDEADWVWGLLFSGPGTPGLVVDLWSPGPIFLRHVEEFGDTGCMEAAYALGLWRAGSSFQVVQGARLTPTAAVPPPLQSHDYSRDRRAFTSDQEERLFRVPGGACLRSEAVASTASIYSAFLRQVENVYRRPWSRRTGRTYQDRGGRTTNGRQAPGDNDKI